MYSMLFGNNSGGGANALLDGASFYLELTHTAVPQRGSITPSFTRATTETGQKWDEAGYLDFTALVGEIVWKGARREYNQWTTSSVSLANGANKSLTLAAGTYQFSMGAGTGTATFSGTGGATGTLAASTDRVAVAKTITAGTFVVTASVADLADLQVCNITGETDQTTIRPYVSVGVPANWWGTESVSNGTFDAGTTGWTGVNNGTLSVANGELTVTCGAAGNGTGEQAITTVVGQKYVVSATVRSGGAYAALIAASATSGGFSLGATSTTSTSNVFLTFEFTATGTTTYIGCRNTAALGYTGIYDNVSVKPAVYLGSGVDGVKCYSTDRSGNPISTSGSYPLVGYVPWEARTNSKLQSNSFTTNGAGAPWGVYGTPTATQNLVGPDGTTSGWTLTDNAAGGTEAIWQVVTLTAAFWADSIFVKKTTGAQASYPVFSADNGTLISAVTIDTSNGVATSWTGYTGLTIATGSTARITSWNADWWRVENVFTGTAAAWNFVYHTAGTTNPTQAAGVVDLTAQGSMGIAFSQTELGSFATPYIPTTTDAVARNASVEAVTTSGAILAAGGTISLTYIPYHAPSGTIALWGTYVDASNYTAILHDATNLIFRKRIAGSNYDATIANAFTSGTTYKMTASWGAGGSTIYLNGVAGTPHANTTAAQIAATMQFGADGNSLQQPGAAVIKNYIWQRQLSGSEQAAVTA